MSLSGLNETNANQNVLMLSDSFHGSIYVSMSHKIFAFGCMYYYYYVRAYVLLFLAASNALLPTVMR